MQIYKYVIKISKFADMKKSILIIPLLVTLLLSCETDFNVNAEWKEVTVVFGLLDQSQDTQYIRINKAFLGNENADNMAMISDSIHYDPSILDVKMYKVSSQSNILDSISLIAQIREKDEGMFATEGNIIYAFPTNNNFLVDNKEYNLVINNIESGNRVTGNTNLIHDFDWVGNIDFELGFYNNVVGSFTSNTIKWKHTKNAAIYQLTMDVHYYEYSPSSQPEDGVIKTISKVFPIIKGEGSPGETELIQQITGEEFFNFLDNAIDKDGTVYRKLIDSVDIFVSVASSDLQTYINLNKPPIGIVQERPIFTNINNGIGLFSCRYNKSQSRQLTPQTHQKVVDYLDHLNFQYDQ